MSPETQPLPEVRPLTVLDRLGGWWGIVGTGGPQVVFAMLTNVTSLPVTAGVALAVAVVFGVIRKLRGEETAAALGGVLGVGIAAGIALWTGSASDFFLVGVVTSAAFFVPTAGSFVLGRPVTGVLWNALHGGGHPWREDRPSRRAHDLATAAAASMFGARALISGLLWWTESVAGLALARIVLGVPLTALVALVVFWAFRRTTHRLVTPARVAARSTGSSR
ncbi:DUF3159 domain-containing protein [Actinomycetospora soli]|uniref:DUF3159 domain-containing protein n=1 Tax=Actinomycetospora soli TaxID=2893887 RepID=UPI001E51E2C5|nr:DUF3159 domain-containing protein [Actinomycetospora soli]MCD2185922.1 DUF3159 domain-containing protein [Actinomycetospora soli]